MVNPVTRRRLCNLTRPNRYGARLLVYERVVARVALHEMLESYHAVVGRSERVAEELDLVLAVAEVAEPVVKDGQRHRAIAFRVEELLENFLSGHGIDQQVRQHACQCSVFLRTSFRCAVLAAHEARDVHRMLRSCVKRNGIRATKQATA